VVAAWTAVPAASNAGATGIDAVDVGATAGATIGMPSGSLHERSTGDIEAPGFVLGRRG
jgi:hypothetical protein